MIYFFIKAKRSFYLIICPQNLLTFIHKALATPSFWKQTIWSPSSKSLLNFTQAKNYEKFVKKVNQMWSKVLTGNSHTQSRSELVDFSFPITMSTLRILHLKEKTESTDWTMYTNSFLKETWFSVLTSLLTIFVIFISIIFLQNQVILWFMKLE